MTAMIPFPADAVFAKGDQPMTTSLKVAEIFGKRHDRVIRAIKDLDCSEEFRRPNFGEGLYADKNGQMRPMYDMSFDGFIFLAMGFTGAEAARYKEEYIRLFNLMRERLAQRAAAQPIIAPPKMRVVPEDRYYELIECENQVLRGDQRQKITRDMKRQIIAYHNQGMKPSEIRDLTGVNINTISTQIYKYKKGELN